MNSFILVSYSELVPQSYKTFQSNNKIQITNNKHNYILPMAGLELNLSAAFSWNWIALHQIFY